MKIDSSSIFMSADRAFFEAREQKERIEAWKGDRRPSAEAPEARRALPSIDRVELSGEAKARLDSLQSKADLFKTKKKDDVEDSQEPAGELLIRKLLIEALTGVKIKVSKVEELSEGQQEQLDELAEDANRAESGRVGWGVDYALETTSVESETVSYTAEGTIRTSDGEEFSFTLDLNMDRVSVEHTNLNIRAGDAVVKDPLVINFDGPAAKLTSAKFSFDIDSDGTADNMSFVGKGSGFLAIDLNKDNKVNNGSELFGPSTGNGFQELSSLDSDANGWIDESDQAWSDLRVWTKDAEGKDTLSTLAQKGIGALYLDSAEARFDLRDDTNSLNGQVVRSGVYLAESGDVGTMQQVDLVV